MESKLLESLRRYDMLRPGDTVICAVSGGADSMALLWGMYLLADKLGVRVEAAHFNHHLRGAESDRDEAFVREFCGGHNIPLHVGSGRVTPGKKGLEAAAREARYAYLRSLDGIIATAHTANDNAETVLMHLVRGTGLRGLGGITPKSDGLIRPMLDVTRREVEAFLRENWVEYIHDSSNDSDAFLRNRLRHSVMPLLEQENPSIYENLSAMAQRLRQDEAVLQDALQTEQIRSVSGLRRMAPAMQRRALERFLRESGVKEPEARHIEQARRLIEASNPSAYARFPGGVTIRRRYDILERDTGKPMLPPRLLPVGGEVELPEAGLLARCVGVKPADETRWYRVCPVGQITVRSRQAGDEVTLPGGTKSLKKLFIDRKIPADRRLAIPVAADAAGVLCVWDVGVNLSRTTGEQPVWIQFENISAEAEERNDTQGK